jgi:LacI family transcriptional regulator
MRATIKDIAREAGVSITTVSRVINGEEKGVGPLTRKKVLEVAKQLNYSPNHVARSLVMKKTQVIGVIIPDIINPFFPELIRGIEDVAAEANYSIILCNSDGDDLKEKNYLTLLKDKGVDGIVYTGVHGINEENATFLKQLDIPFVCLDRAFQDKNINCVSDDGVYGMYIAVKYLIEKGHKEIAYLSGSMETSTGKDRLEGYKKALKESKFEVCDKLIVEGNFDLESGSNGVLELLKRNSKYTAIACANDSIAIGAIAKLRELNIQIPKQVSVVGYDDVQMAKLCCPPLTTIAQDKYGMGQKTMQVLLKQINNEYLKNEFIIIKSKLVKRDSVAKRGE